MSITEPTERLLDPEFYATEFARWLDGNSAELIAASQAIPVFEQRVEVMRELMAALFDGGWSRYGWPEELGGLGGTILHRAAMWGELARRGIRGMAVFEHLEVLAPTLAALGPNVFVREALPGFLRGDACWAQGFSEPEAGSDLATVRTRATAVEGGYVVSGRKIWTSWAKYARWCRALTRTGSPESRHRGLTALIIDLDSPHVEVSPIEQANGTDELAEVVFDEVFVPSSRVVGEVGGGWAVAMHILSHERGTYAWFRHCFLHHQLAEGSTSGGENHDAELGSAILDLAAVTATSHAALITHSDGAQLGPQAAFTKLLLCEAERSVNNWLFADDPGIAFGLGEESAIRRQEYLFSRIVSVYGG